MILSYQLAKTSNNYLEKQNINASDIILDDFIADLDATQATKETYLKGVRKFLKWCKNNEVQEIQRKNIIEYKEHLKTTLKASTVSTNIIAIKKLFKYLESKGINNATNGIKGVKNSKGFKKDALTTEQVKELLESIDTSNNEGLRNYTLIYLLLVTGLRTIEIERANIEDLRIIGSQPVLFVQGKGREDKDDYIKLTYETYKLINNYINTRNNKNSKDPLFISYSDRTNGQRLKTRSIRDIVKKALMNIGIDNERITTHSLRHTAITLLLLGGGTIQEAQTLARHRDINTTTIYAHNIDKLNARGGELIENLINIKRP